VRLSRAREPCYRLPLLVYAIVDRSSSDNPLGDAIETFIRREDAEQFIARVKGDDPQRTFALSSVNSRPAG